MVVPAPPWPSAGAFPVRDGRSQTQLTIAGEARDVELFVPARRDEHPPMVLLLHGTNGSGGQVIDESGAERVAEAQGVVLVAPVARWRDGQYPDFDHPRAEETYWETGPSHDPAQNHDLALVAQSLEAATQAFHPDPSRVFLAGHSNGAFFALVVATVFRERFAAMALNAGGVVRCPTTASCHFRGRGTSCQALRALPGWCPCAGPPLPVAVTAVAGWTLPTLLVHGTDDPLISVQYACDLADDLTRAGHPVRMSLRQGEGHVLAETFFRDAWAFFQGSRRAAPAALVDTPTAR